MELDFKILVGLLEMQCGEGEGNYFGELLEGPFVVFTRIVAGEIGRCDIRDCFGVDANYLWVDQL